MANGSLGTTFPGVGSYGDPSQAMSTGGAVGDANAKKRRPNPVLDQIMAQRGQAQQRQQMGALGGPQYLDYIDQMMMNPMNTWY